MKSLITTTFFPATVALLVAAAMPVHAQTCHSVCNQIRRACNHSAKGAMKAAYVGCDETRDACTDECDGNATTCPDECETAHGDCLTGGGTSELCDAARTQCLDECATCSEDCGAARNTCRAEARATRDGHRAGCDDSRSQCRSSCVDPLDKTCVHPCTTGEHDCRGSAKRMEVACKKECPNGGGRKSCIRACRQQGSLDTRLCEDLAVVCYAGCAGIEVMTALP